MKSYAWRRFWIRRDGVLRLDDDGFLLDPEDPVAGRLNADAVLLQTLREVPCLILLGEPGIGKSTALDDEIGLVESGLRLKIDLRDFTTDAFLVSRVFESREIQDWSASDQVLDLFLDSMDECAIDVRSLSGLLTAELKKLPVERLRLRIACRTAVWPETLHSALGKIWSDLYEMELAPLRRRDVILAARAEGIDDSAFLDQVSKNAVGAFASRPITLRFLLSTYRREQSLPSSLAKLYEDGCTHLCRENAPSRRDVGRLGRLSPPQRLALASQVAATALLTRRATVFAGSDATEAAPDDLALEALLWGYIDGEDRIVTEQDLREILDTGLFSGRAGRRHGFSHWTFAEFLTARYLTKLSDKQVGDLLFRRSLDGRARVVPQLREVAAWVSRERPAILGKIVENDPQVLLGSALLSLDPRVRASVAQSLLELASDERIADYALGSRQRYASLRHPGLASQIRPFLTDDTHVLVARRMAIDIAVSCECGDVTDDLVKLALNAREKSPLRIMAAYAVVRIGQQTHKEQLRPLLETTLEEDPDDELRGCALEAIWPSGLSAEELFEKHLKDARDENVYGSYGSFVWSLPGRLEREHLPAALDWVARQPSDHQQSMRLDDLAPAIMRTAWPHTSDDIILKAFVKAAVHRLRQHDDVLGEREAERRGDVGIREDQVGRRRLAVAIVEACHCCDREEQRLIAMRIGTLLQPEDLPWVLERHGSPSQRDHRAWWLELLWYTFREGDLLHAEALMAAARERPEVRAHFSGLLEPIEIGSPRAGELRENYRRRALAMRGPTLPKRKEVSIPEQVEGSLRRIERGEVEQWWQLNVTLARSAEDPRGVDEFEADLTKLPAWRLLDGATRNRILDAALLYIKASDPATEDWICRSIFHRPAAAGYRAVRLLLKEQPTRLSDVSPGSWAKWAPAVLTFGEHQRSEDEAVTQKCVALAYQHAPGVILRCLDMVIADQARNHPIGLVLWKLGAAWDSRLARAVLRRMADPAVPGSSAVEILKFALGRDEVRVLSRARKILKERQKSSRHKERAVLVTAALLEEIPAKVWSEIWAHLHREKGFGRAVLNRFAAEWYPASTPKLLTDLSERALADLYLWLRRNLPEAALGGRAAAREGPYALRDSVFGALKGRGTVAAVLELGRVAARLPSDSWLKYAVLDAEDVRLRESWDGIAISEFRKMIADTDVRLLDDGEQLVQVVLDSLKRLEERCRRETPRVYDLWNESPPTPKPEARLSDYIKRHLDDDIKQRGIIANREVEVSPIDRLDIRVDAVRMSRGKPIGTLSAILEVKGCWNRGLMKDMKAQLRDRYMVRNGVRYGLYVVGWYRCLRWAKSDARRRRAPKWSANKAESVFERQASELSGQNAVLRACVLRLELPSRPRSRVPATPDRVANAGSSGEGRVATKRYGGHVKVATKGGH